MSVNFCLTPYDPTEMLVVNELPRSEYDLRLDPEWYARQIQKQWPATRFFSICPDVMLLEWDLSFPVGDPPVTDGCSGALHKDHYTISIDSVYTPFILWHRKIIPRKYQLYFWASYDVIRSLKLELNTTVKDIDIFMDGYSTSKDPTE